MTPDVSVEEHKSRKVEAYWADLVEGETGLYKAGVIKRLVDDHLRIPVRQVLDIGCGTSEIARRLAERIGSERVVGVDYDAEIIDKLRRHEWKVGIDTQWRVADIFDIGAWDERFELVFLLDILHEVYSFVGRSDDGKGGQLIINHQKGLDATYRALDSIAKVVPSGGGIVITDDILPDHNESVEVKAKNPKVLSTLKTFVEEYPSRQIDLEWTSTDTFRIPAHDFSIVLTQYNKLKNGDLQRWNVEKLEIHQYFREADYRDVFRSLGFTPHIVVGTPCGARDEWCDDFEMLFGLPSIPAKRVSVLAVRD
ncbi:MAG: methyltransferase domain-containing protein [Alphaproteobacteria bacterium]|nr:methyltransferase domain-containing protein [Alphaproteobacteria bacterium]